MGIQSFTQLDVWRKAHQNVLEIYRISREFPKEEIYALTSQIRRSAFSVPANIAEGFGRLRSPDKARLYNIAQGSAEELKYFVILARDLSYLRDSTALWTSLEDVSRMLRRLTQTTRNS